MEGLSLVGYRPRTQLEQVGPYRLIRPEARALWEPSLPEAEWDRAVAEYRGADEDKKGTLGEKWRNPRLVGTRIRSRALYDRASPASAIWDFPRTGAALGLDGRKSKDCGAGPVKVLNLFAYTGIASLVLAEAGAQVTHVDASKQSIAWARENQELSKLSDKPIRWIVDDALAFVKREARRGNTYDAIVMDPPKFGRGPKGEVWKAEESLRELLDACGAILSPNPLFTVVTVYTIPLPAVALAYAVGDLLAGVGGTVSCGELANREQVRGRLVPTAVFARWSI